MRFTDFPLFNSAGRRELCVVALVLLVSLLACCCTFVHANEPLPELSVGAIAGRPPAAAVNDGPQLDLSAIAQGRTVDTVRCKIGEPCKCLNCPLKTDHNCGDPGCDCSTCGPSKRMAMPALCLTAISPQKAPAVTATKPVQIAAAAKPAKVAPHLELRRVCHGNYCTQQWVWVE
jgi:hypothetical protein